MYMLYFKDSTLNSVYRPIYLWGITTWDTALKSSGMSLRETSLSTALFQEHDT